MLLNSIGLLSVLSRCLMLVAFMIPARGQLAWKQLLSVRSGHSFTSDTLHGNALLFGGNGLNSVWGDTWLWDGASWSQVRVPGPSARRDHAAVFDAARGVVLLFGGRDSSGLPVNGDTWRWDGASWMVVATGGPSRRSSHAMAYDATRQVVVMFGGQGQSSALSDTWEWNGSIWSALAVSGPVARKEHAMAYHPSSSKVVLYGGKGASGGGLGDTWEWDGAFWVPRFSMQIPGPRSGHAMAYDAVAGKIVMIGDGGSSQYSEEWLWDGAGWQPGSTQVPSVRVEHAMSTHWSSGQAVVFGGALAYQPDVADKGDLLIRQGAVWSAASYTYPDALLSSACYDAARGVVVAVGASGQGTWEWSGGAWSRISPNSPHSTSPQGMCYHAGSGQTLLFAGTSLHAWDGASWTALAAPSSPVVRHGHAFCYDPIRDVAVLTGGYDTNTGAVSGDVWEWSGSAWSNRGGVGSAPPARHGHVMAFDGSSGKMWLSCGTNNNAFYPTLNDSWWWDGVSWQGAVSVTGRYWHAAAFNSDANSILVHGGFYQMYNSNNGPLADAWRVSGQSSSSLSLGGDPGARYRHIMVHSDRARVTLMLSGVKEVWALGFEADVVPYGFGCGSSALNLVQDPSAPPIVGASARVEVVNSALGVAFLAIGSNKDWHAGFPLPLPLDGLGMPGCRIWGSADLYSAWLMGINSSGVPDLSIPIPNNREFLGASLFLQGWAPAPTQNAAGFATSNGLHWVFGSRP